MGDADCAEPLALCTSGLERAGAVPATRGMGLGAMPREDAHETGRCGDE